ncbi:hypothetical protein EDD27_9648 [Nonomuraea polychroma]|uniref:Pectate lyase-like protein n=1 Tax=Nonomuraea polychroma TaxID=46176 RepID=A0A438MMA9_9ACTN|nr:hypothetical protein [Nonomuraea polychroma]RVX46746.1 hypothetical protein EDD27_9648 [Nonomuraea polychroma]
MTQKDSGLSRRVLLRAPAVGAAAAGLAVLSGQSPASAMATPPTVYDVTTWRHSTNPAITCYTDIGALINDIIADIKTRQPNQSSKPGAVIYIPPGDYPLKTRVTVDVSYLTIRGDGHGFASSSIRYNAGDTWSWHEIWPGGSRIRVENTDGKSEAFLVSRSGDPRLSSVVFDNFCLDGLSFTPNQNAYTNGKIGIRVDTANDAFRIERMGFVYLERALIVRDADALSVRGNFIAECGSCVELIGSGQASKVTDNHIGAGHIGYSPPQHKDDLYGVVHLRGDGNMVTGNLFAYDVAPAKITPSAPNPPSSWSPPDTTTTCPTTAWSATSRRTSSCSMGAHRARR